MQWISSELDQFVIQSDSLGGPTALPCQEFWKNFTYHPMYKVDQSLDPFSELYVAEQVVLYEEISGRSYDVRRSELTNFDVERHIVAANPCDHPNPTALAIHLQRLSRALRCANPQRGETLLDMGCGWGLSSELSAYLGLSVIAVDINPDFVRLVHERASIGGRTIVANLSTFEDFRPPEPVDIALFYECLHHAIRPWLAASNVAAGLKQSGRIVLAGEPINDIWWKNWGIRLDPISIYCIRKFGWFESGWSLKFIQEVIFRAGLIPSVYTSDDKEMGYVIVGTKFMTHHMPGAVAAKLFKTSGSVVDGEFLILVGVASLSFRFPTDSPMAVLNVINFRGRDLRVFISDGGEVLFTGNMPPGPSAVKVIRNGDMANLHLEVERWVPNEEIHNGDSRIIGLHLKSIDFTR